MKRKLMIVASILAIAGLTSCEKDLYDPNQTDDTKVTDLIISPDFNWNMSKDVTCNISSNFTAKLSIYQDESCSANGLLATIPVKAGSTVKLPLSVLRDSRQVYVQYTEGTKPVAVDVANGEINFEVPEMPVSRAQEDFEELRGTIYYPNALGGTIMFEDSYPRLGDYDFNDFAASYVAEVTTDETKKFIDEIKFSMQIRAIGASKVYIPHLGLRSFSPSYVESIKVDEGEVHNLDVQQFKDTKEKVVFAFNGAENKGDKEFFNTVQGEAPELTKKFAITIKFKKEVPIDFLYIDKFDIFLATKDHTEEIHTYGYGPSLDDKLFSQYETIDFYTIAGSNLICGINIPEVIEHAYEKVDFLKAYPDFKEWVTNKTDNSNKWYLNGKSEFLFKMK